MFSSSFSLSSRRQVKRRVEVTAAWAPERPPIFGGTAAAARAPNDAGQQSSSSSSSNSYKKPRTSAAAPPLPTSVPADDEALSKTGAKPKAFEKPPTKPPWAKDFGFG